MTEIYGSSGTAEGLRGIMGKFWFCNPAEIDLKECGSVYKNGKKMRVEWCKKGKRYRFGK